jgi:hypothetical protein
MYQFGIEEPFLDIDGGGEIFYGFERETERISVVAARDGFVQ